MAQKDIMRVKEITERATIQNRVFMFQTNDVLAVYDAMQAMNTLEVVKVLFSRSGIIRMVGPLKSDAGKYHGNERSSWNWKLKDPNVK